MNFEGKSKKQEQANSPENKEGKEFSISEIDDVLKQKTDIFDSLDKYTKDEIFKNIGFRGVVEIKDKAEDNYDSYAYEKAGLWKKFDNFITFGLFKEFLGLVRAKDGELLDKTAIRDGMEGGVWNFVDREGDAYKHEEQKISKQFNITEEDSAKRIITKTYEFVDGKIEKLIKSSRTEEGMMEAAGKLREEQISQCEKKDGADLVALKESMEKNSESRKNLPEVMKFVKSDGEKERIIEKLDEEERQTKEKIEEKEYKIDESLKIFREPLEGRLEETLKIEGDLSEVYKSAKSSEDSLNNQIREHDAMIKKAQKLNLLGGVGGEIVKNIEEGKALLEAQVKEFTERKALVSAKLEIIKNNKKEIEATLAGMKNIGKTKKEILEEEKSRKKAEPKAKPDDAEGKEDEGEKKNTWNKDRKEAWGLKGANYSLGKGGQEADKEDDAAEKETEEVKAGDRADAEVEKFAKKKFSKKELEEIKKVVLTRLKSRGFENIKSDKEKEFIIKKSVNDIKEVLAKSKKPVTETSIKDAISEYIRIGGDNRDKDNVLAWKLWSKKSESEPVIDPKEDGGEREKEEDEESENGAEKTFTEKEIEDIVTTYLKKEGLSRIKDKKIQDQITKNVITNVKKMVAESEEPITEIDIRKETKRILHALFAGYSQKNK